MAAAGMPGVLTRIAGIAPAYSLAMYRRHEQHDRRDRRHGEGERQCQSDADARRFSGRGADKVSSENTEKHRPGHVPRRHCRKGLCKAVPHRDDPYGSGMPIAIWNANLTTARKRQHRHHPPNRVALADHPEQRQQPQPSRRIKSEMREQKRVQDDQNGGSQHGARPSKGNGFCGPMPLRHLAHGLIGHKQRGTAEDKRHAARKGDGSHQPSFALLEAVRADPEPQRDQRKRASNDQFHQSGMNDQTRGPRRFVGSLPLRLHHEFASLAYLVKPSCFSQSRGDLVLLRHEFGEFGRAHNVGDERIVVDEGSSSRHCSSPFRSLGRACS